MKKLVIIDQTQFGYHTDNYQYCKYLKGEYNIVFICWDQGLLKIEMDAVMVFYVNRKDNILVRSIRFFHQTLKHIKDNQKIVFIKYFKVVSIALRLLRPSQCFVLDIRTGSVHKNQLQRKFEDARLIFETRFFKNVTVVSQSLADKLNIAHKAHVLPLGSDVISSTAKTFEQLHLLYVGTLFNRKIDVTIQGFKEVYNKIGRQTQLSYTIIGSGPNNEECVLRDMVARYGLSDKIYVTGYIPHTLLKPWFDAANVGIAYVPMTSYYDCQPVTKIFEYHLSGMPVIATRTSENQKVIDSENGELISDTVEGFCSGMIAIFERRHMFDSAKIRKKSMKFTWEIIVKDNLLKYFNRILK